MSDKTIPMFNGMNREERGQVGIGTLIVFIALVLVAAIAAGVLINTAGLLQEQGEQTGQETQDQVSNQIDVLSSEGQVNNDTIDAVNLTVQPSAGASVIDLNESFVEVATNDSVYTYEIADDENASIANETNAVLEVRDDRATIDIVMESPLDAGESADITIVTGDGAERFITVDAPDLMPDSGEVSV